jgi:hypothetical protein
MCFCVCLFCLFYVFIFFFYLANHPASMCALEHMSSLIFSAYQILVYRSPPQVKWMRRCLTAADSDMSAADEWARTFHIGDDDAARRGGALMAGTVLRRHAVKNQQIIKENFKSIVHIH